MTAYYLYSFVATFAFGILLATFAEFSLLTLYFILGLSILGGIFWYRSKFLGSEIIGWLLFSLALVGLVLGIARTEMVELQFGFSALEEQVGQEIEFSGVIVKEPDVRENSLRLFVQNAEDKILVTTDRYVDISYGDEVKVVGRLSKPEDFETEFGRIFNYKGYLLVDKVEYQISFAEVAVLDSGLGNSLITNLLKFKSAFMENLEAVVVEPAAGLGEGLLLGVKQALGDELETAFRKTGIIHIVVLSGYNVMLVVAFVMYVLGYFLSIRPKVIVGIVAIVLFALLVGLSATVVRASIMAGLLLIAYATSRTYLVLRGLMVAGFVMLLFNPLLLVYDVGFQLSFLATLGLILIAPQLERWFSAVPTVLGMRMFLTATVATQIAVLPLLLYQIGQFSVVSVIVNLLVLPMVPVAMLLTFATGILAFVSAKLALLVAVPTYWSLTYINTLALWFGELSFSATVVPVFSWWVVVVTYVAMAWGLWFLYKRNPVLGEGDLASELITKEGRKNEGRKKAGQDDLSDWTTIEETDEFVAKLKEEAKKKNQTNTQSDSSDTPIFFR